MTLTDKKPTVPGAYWWQRDDKAVLFPVQIVKTIFGELIVYKQGPLAELGGLWSSRLVPADESEAYQEGYQHAFDEIVHSRARRVVEGKDGV